MSQVPEQPLAVSASQAATGSTTRTNLFSRRGSQDQRGCIVRWQDLSLSLVQKGQVKRKILADAWGEALPFETTAIMGASGAGKTSLFNCLSGRLPVKGKLHLDGDIRFDDIKVNYEENIEAIQKRIALVAQEDILHQASTPREAIRFSARLRLPRDTSDEAIDNLVSNVIENLGLEKACDSIIGGGLRKGISGGEKKRTSIGVELVTDPSVIMLDEPTSGLDSFAAAQVIELLKKISRSGNTVLFTIHQPSSQVFFSFDKLILLHGGRLMYSGKVADVPDDFDRRGYPVPRHVSPADWIVDVAQRCSEEELENAEFYGKNDIDLGAPSERELKAKHIKTATFGMETMMLLDREWKTMYRLPFLFMLNIGITVVVGLCSGMLFLGIGDGDRADAAVLQGILGAIVNSMLNGMMGQSSGALIMFATEKPLFLREFSTSTFGIVPYVLSQWVMELFRTVLNLGIQSLLVYYMAAFEMGFFVFFGISVITSLNATSMASLLGSSVSDPMIASAMFPLVVLPQFYFSGVLVAINLIPKWLRWLQYVCALRYATALSLGYELDTCTADSQQACDAFLDVMGVDLNDRTWFWIVFVALFVVAKGGSIILLMVKGSSSP